MIRHDTPESLAFALAKYRPKKMASLLDPAVGTGVLLKPFAHDLKASLGRVVCVDSDPFTLRRVATGSQDFDNRLERICADFLTWSPTFAETRKNELFDCVVMNPPFRGRTKVTIPTPNLERSSSQKLYVPIEVAFVMRAIDLLNPNGRLLAIVPASLVSSVSASLIRHHLIQLGSVRVVHELPPYTFSGVEGRVYLFVFQKSHVTKAIWLSNHDLARPVSMKINICEIGNKARFDYKFHAANQQYDELMAASPHLDWKPISAVANVHRGAVESPNGRDCAIHTCDYKDGFWGLTKSKSRRIRKDKTSRGIKKGDLLLKRVGRACSQSLGPILGHIGDCCSDCLLIIRFNQSNQSVALLLSLRIVLNSTFGRAILESGTGASYITSEDLLRTLVPTKISYFFMSQFRNYRLAVAGRNFRKMVKIENEVRKLIQ